MARPEVGQAINVRLGDDRLEMLGAFADALGVSRAEALRRAVELWLSDKTVTAQVRDALSAVRVG